MSAADLLRAARAGMAAFRAALEPPAPAPPAAAPPPPIKPPKTLHPRVLALLAQIGVTPQDFAGKLARGPAYERALAARRAVVVQLQSEGWTRAQIARACGLTWKTVRAHLTTPAKP